MSYSLDFAALVEYDPGKPGIDLPIRIGLPADNMTEVAAKVDTGSTFCIFSRETAEAIGLTVEDGLPVSIRTAAGSFLTYQHEVSLSVAGFEFDAMCCFAAHPGFERNVLGRHGFLMRMKIGIDDYEGRFYLDRSF